MGFGISSIELSGFATALLVILRQESKWN